MLPTPLQFEFKPRRDLPGLRLAVVGLVLLLAAGALAWLVPRQLELNRLQAATSEAAANAVVQPGSPSASAPPQPWHERADQDGKLFALTLESRLLEIERCTGDKMTVTRIAHDEQAGSTTLDLAVVTADDLSGLVGCLNTDVGSDHRWRLSTVEALPQAIAGAPAPGQRAVLRRD